jgi:hypothetical protein
MKEAYTHTPQPESREALLVVMRDMIEPLFKNDPFLLQEFDSVAYYFRGM